MTGEELLKRRLQVGQKSFQFLLGRNERGLFWSISEMPLSTQRPRRPFVVITTDAGLPWFAAVIQFIIQNTQHQREIPTKELRVGFKVYFFSYIYQEHGAYIRISECGGPRGRSSLIIPEEGRGHERFLQALFDLITSCTHLLLAQGVQPQYCTDIPSLLAEISRADRVVGPGTEEAQLVHARDGAPIIICGNKRFFVDPGSNQRGVFIKLSETIGTDASARMSIVIPIQAVPLLVHTLNQAAQQLWREMEYSYS